MAKYWVVEANYPLASDLALDSKLIELVGKETSGSGAGFGRRDLDWVFNNEGDATTAVNNLTEYSVAHRELKIEAWLTEHADEE